jgi:hypothetical protein
MQLGRTLPDAEDVRGLTAQHPSDKPPAVSRATHDLLDRDLVLGQFKNDGVGPERPGREQSPAEPTTRADRETVQVRWISTTPPRRPQPDRRPLPPPRQDQRRRSSPQPRPSLPDLGRHYRFRRCSLTRPPNRHSSSHPRQVEGVPQCHHARRGRANDEPPSLATKGASIPSRKLPHRIAAVGHRYLLRMRCNQSGRRSRPTSHSESMKRATPSSFRTKQESIPPPALAGLDRAKAVGDVISLLAESHLGNPSLPERFVRVASE